MASEEIVQSFETLPANFVPLIQPAAGISYLYQWTTENTKGKTILENMACLLYCYFKFILYKVYA